VILVTMFYVLWPSLTVYFKLRVTHIHGAQKEKIQDV